MYDCRFAPGTPMAVIGPTGAGKSHFVNNMIIHKDTLFQQPPEKILYFYKFMQDGYKNLQQQCPRDVLEFHQGAPESLDYLITLLDKTGRKSPKMVIMDDLAFNLQHIIEDLTLAVAHHFNTVVVFIAQTMFAKHPSFRVVSLNLGYLIYFKNYRDASQITTLGSQIGGSSNFLKSVYKNELKKPHSYLLFDFVQNQADEIRIRSDILPGQEPMRTFIPN